MGRTGESKIGVKDCLTSVPATLPAAPRAWLTVGSRESQWPDDLARQVWLGADAAQIADAIVSTLREIEAVLRPIVGRGGFDAIYARCMSLAGRVHPWLTAAREPVQMPIELDALGAVLAVQSRAEAAACGIALLQTFDGLLAMLIGRPLTERLLGSVALRLPSPGGVATALDSQP
jgi:hypothetical protein